MERNRTVLFRNDNFVHEKIGERRATPSRG
jgi:hypothetical protein